MEKIIKESNENKRDTTIEKFKKIISQLKKEKSALEKENAKLTNKNAKQYAELRTCRNMVRSLKKLLPNGAIPLTLEEVVKELEKDEK